jgi:hypothetical protein
LFYAISEKILSSVSMINSMAKAKPVAAPRGNILRWLFIAEVTSERSLLVKEAHINSGVALGKRKAAQR